MDEKRLAQALKLGGQQRYVGYLQAQATKIGQAGNHPIADAKVD